MTARPRKLRLIILIALLALVVIAGTISYTRSKVDKNSMRPAEDSSLVTIAKNLNTPWSVVFYGDTALISSRDTGQVLELNTESGTTRVVGVVPGAVHRREGGLLGLAVDGQKRLYAYYTTESDNRVSRFMVSGEPGSLSLGKAETIIQGLPSASFHNGGRIAFGPDKLLYVTVGDAGDTGSAQELSSLSGKILRMTPDGKVPANNPFTGSVVYSYGHRNPQGITWADDGTMFATEFGQNSWDELNIIKSGSNYGWPEVEGVEEGRNEYVDPVQQWTTSEASPSGMAYAGGILYIANLRGEVLRTVPVNDPGSSKDYYPEVYGRIRDVTVAPDGNIWFVTNNTDGRGKPAADDDRILSLRRSD